MSTAKAPTMDEIKAACPMPWRYTVLGTGQVVVLDNLNREVPMFTMLAFITDITARMAFQNQQPKEQPA